MELHAARFKRIRHVLLPKLSPISRQKYVILGRISGFDARTSTASPTTDSRSWITKRRCGWWVASVSDCLPTPPPTSTTSEPSGIFSQVLPSMIPIIKIRLLFFSEPHYMIVPSRMALEVVASTLVMAAPNRTSRNLLSGRSSQLHMSSSVL